MAVADNETPIISIADASASESDGIVEFTVTATAAYEELTVNWKTSDGTATPGSDYTANSGKVVFNEGETSKTIRVNLIDDSTAEGDETFIVTLSNPTEAVLSSASAVGTIEDDDALFVLTVTTSDGDVEEGEPASITFSRGPEEGTATSEDLYSDPVKIRFKLTQQGDFLSRTEEAFGDVNVIYNETTGAGSLIMPGGQPDLTLNLTTVDDSQGEYDGSITLTLTPSTNSAYIVGQPGSATVNVSDNDVGISIADAYADEGDFRTDALGIRGAFFTVSLSRAADAEVTVFAWTVDGTATSGRNVTANSLGRDYYSRSERLVFQPGETEVVFEVLIAGDTFDESETEFFTVSLDLANVEILDAEAVGRISDDDKPLVARVHRESRTVDEDAEEPVKFRFELTAQEGSNTTAAEFSTAMLWTVTPGTATAGEDYVAVDGIQRTELQVGEVSKTAEVSLIDDSLFEAQNETFTFTMTESIHAIYSSDNQAIEITIRDDDEMQAAVAAVSENALEGDDASLTVTLSPSLSTAPVEVIYAVVGTAGSADYVTPSGTLTIPAGESSGTVTISTLVDNIPDPGETLGVQLTRATSNGREITIPPRGDSPPTVTILDHRTLSASIIAGEPADEGDNVEFTVSLSVTHSAPVHVDWATSDGEGQAAATGGDDYTSASGSVTIPVGNKAATFTVATLVDNLFEGDETFIARLTGAKQGADPDSATSIDLGVSSATGTIADNNPSPTVITLTVTPESVSEGAGETELSVTATLGGESRLPHDLHVVTPLVDSLTIPAGQASGTGVLTFTPEDDEIDEEDRTETIEGLAPGFNVIPATFTITDDDDPPTGVNLTVAPNAIGEGAGKTDLTVTGTLTGGSLRSVDTQVTLSVGGVSIPSEDEDGNPSTAAGSDDFTAPAAVILTIPAGQRTGTATVTFTPTNDIVVEGDETAQVSGDSGDLEVSTAVLTIEDDDDEPDGIRLSVSPAAALEYAGAVDVQVTATLEGGGARLVATTLLLSVEDVTATVGEDFTEPLDVSLTIPAGQLSGVATLSISLVNDNIHEGTEEVAIRGTNEDPGLLVTGARVSITDDDEAPTQIVLSIDRAEVSEGGGPQQRQVTAEFQGSRRSVGTLLSLTLGEGTAVAHDYSAFAATLIIPAGKQQGVATMVIFPTNDYVVEGDETAQIRGSTSLPDLEVQPAFVTITDDDTAGLTITPAALVVSEGSSGTYMVVLDNQPSGDVTVTVSGQAGTDLTLSGLSAANALIFTTTNWFTAQTVTVTSGEDSDGVDDPATLTHTAAGGKYAGTTAALPVTVADDDRGIVITPSSLSLDEGDATGVSYTVKLATQPSETVTITVTGQADTDLTLTGLSAANTLTFTADNWDTGQPVTVTAGEDADGVDDSVTLTHTAAGGEYAGTTAALPVTVADNDRGLVLSESSLSLDEGDATGVSYTIELATQPTEEIWVTVSGHSGTDLTLSGLSAANTLTFTTTNWGTGQLVTVTAGEDSDGVNDTATLIHTATRGEYEGTTAELAVTVTDNDRGIVITPSSLSLDEGDDTGVSYTVELAIEPTEEITVTVSGHSGTDLTLSGLSAANTLTFTTTNWDTGQPVTVTAGEDDDGVDDTATLTHTAAGAEYDGTTETLAVTVADNDRGLVLSRTSIDVGEGDATGVSYTVELATQPTEEITVTVTGHSGTDLTLSGLSTANTLTFTTDNWDTGQPVTVTAGEDADGVDDTATLTHTASGGEYDGTTATLAVTVADNDRGLVLSRTSIDVDEGDATGVSYTVELATQPTEEITVTVSGHSGTDLTLSGLSAANALTFTTSNWAAAQTVTVKAGEDADGVDDTATLTHTASGGEYAGTTAALAVTVDDDETVAIVLSKSSLDVAEGDATGASYTVKLATEPSETVTVTVTGQSGTDLTLSGLSAANALTFTTSNWDTGQPVTVTAGEDSDGVDDTVTLTHTAAGGEYAGTTAALAVTVADNDRGLVLSRTSIDVAEGDATGVSYTVKLATQPSEEVTVTVTGHSGTDLTLSGLSATNTLTFTADNWDTAQGVTVKAGEDADGSDDSVTLTHTASGGGYAGKTAELPVTVADNDRGLVLSRTSIDVDEGDATGVSYTVELATQPTEEITVTVTGHSGTDLTLTGLSAANTLTFTTTSWAAGQPVTVTAGEDADGVDDPATLTHTASGGGYAGTTETLAVTVADNDRGLVLSRTSIDVDEGDATGVSYTIMLATQPTEEITVTVSGHSGTDLTLTGLSAANALTFTADNWDTGQPVTVTAGEDSDGVDDTATLTHTAAGGEYAGKTAALAVTVNDNDRGLVLSRTSIDVDEGDATGVSYTIMLATQPSETVTVTVTGQSGTDLTLSGLSAANTLTFTADNWDTGQPVTVTAGEDSDGVDDSVTLTHTAAGGEYAGKTAALPVTVNDNDRGIVITPSSLSLDEGDDTGVSYTVELATQPTEEITVTVSGQAGTDLTLTGLSATNTLTFTTSNWDTAQTVTVKAGQDADGVDDSVTLTHTAAGGGYAGTKATLPVTVSDNDRGLVLRQDLH